MGQKDYFSKSSRPAKPVKIGFQLPNGPVSSDEDVAKATEDGKKFFDKPTVASRNFQQTDSLASTPGTYYTGTAANTNGVSSSEVNQMNLLQQDLLALNARVSADFNDAMDSIVQSGVAVMPVTRHTVRRIEGDNEEDVRRKNGFQVWRAAFANAQAALLSFFPIAEEQDKGTQRWRGDSVSLNFTNEILSRFLTGYGQGIVTSLSNKFKEKQEIDMRQAQGSTSSDFNNVLLTTVIFIDSVTRLVGATLSVTVFSMDHEESTKIKCGRATATGNAAYSFSGIQYNVNASMLRAQVGGNQGAIDDGSEWFGNYDDEGQGQIEGDPDSVPSFFG